MTESALTSDELVIPARRLDSQERCCGRKPIPYTRDFIHLFCPRCDRAYDPATGEQIANWAYYRDGADTFRIVYARMAEQAKK